MIYKGSRDGFSAFNFHLKCDNKGPTVTLLRSATNNNVFGGFTSVPWTSSQFLWVHDDKSFLFSLAPDSHPKKYPQHENSSDYAVYHHSDLLVAFGQGHDLCVTSNCNQNSHSYCRIITTYQS